MTSTAASSARTTWAVAAIVAYLAMVAMNALANLLPLFAYESTLLLTVAAVGAVLLLIAAVWAAFDRSRGRALRA